MRYCDKVAYLNHDFDDAVRAGLIGEGDIPWEIKYTVGRSKSQRIESFVSSLITASSDDIRMAPDVQRAFEALRAFMFEAVYRNPMAKGEEGKAKAMLQGLYRYFVAHPDKLPDEYRSIADAEDIDRAVCDYISGMSDRYAVNVYDSLFVPRSWGL